MATLLSICQRVVRGTGVLSPSVIATSNDETAERLLEAAQVCGELLARMHTWNAMVVEGSITTVASQATYDLPSDFGRILSDTAWDAGSYWRLRGNLGAAEWQWRQNAIAALPETRLTFRVRTATSPTAPTIYLHPTPSDVRTLVYEYVSKNWCKSSGGTGQSAWAADTDIPLLDETLFVLGTRWLFKQSNGLPYIDDRALWQEQVELAIAQEIAPPGVDFGTERLDLKHPNVPDGGFGS